MVMATPIMATSPRMWTTQGATSESAEESYSDEMYSEMYDAEMHDEMYRDEMYDNHEYFNSSSDYPEEKEYEEEEPYSYEPELPPTTLGEDVSDSQAGVSWVGLFDEAAHLNAEGTVGGVIISFGGRSFLRINGILQGLSGRVKKLNRTILDLPKGKDRSAEHSGTESSRF